MKKLLLLPLALLLFISCDAQKNGLNRTANSIEEASQATALVNLLQLQCHNDQKQKDEKDSCKGLDNIDLKLVNKILLNIKRPPIADPCIDAANCKINFDKSRFLRSFFIEKFGLIEIRSKDGKLINDVKKIIPAGTEGLPNAVYIQFKKPIYKSGTLTIKGVSKQLGGDFIKTINLEDL